MGILRDLISLIQELYGDLILYSSVKGYAAYWIGITAIIVLGGLMLYFSRRLGPGRYPILRGINGVFDLERNVEMAAETGKAVHVSVGTGSISDALGLQTLAGIDVLSDISQRSALAGPPLIATTSSAITLPIVESTVSNAYDEVSSRVGYEAKNNRFIAPTPVAYAAGVMRVLTSEDVGFNVMVGGFGDEYLLMGETGAEHRAKQLVAAANPTVLPFVIATADYPVIGEELFALSSYFRPLPARIGSLMAQDVLRLIMVALIIVLILVASFSPEFRQMVAGWVSAPSYP